MVNVYFDNSYVSVVPPSKYTTLVIPDCTTTLAHSLQGYLVTYSVHSLTEGPPSIALYSACLTVGLLNDIIKLLR